jgi:hypothetical protein
MHPRTLALILAAAVAAGCVSNEAKKEEPAAAPPPAAKAAEAPAPATKPECPPPDTTTKKKATTKSSKKTTAKKGEEPTPAADCEPAKPAAAASTAKAAEATPPAASGKESTAGKVCNPCVVKSRDGKFDGEVYGNIPAGSKWAQLRIGMEQPEVERLLGVSNEVHAYPTAKAWIPFYFGTDSTRYEVRYRGQGSVSYTGGSWGGGRGILMMINYDPKM